MTSIEVHTLINSGCPLQLDFRSTLKLGGSHIKAELGEFVQGN